MIYVIKALVYFKDGNILPYEVRQNQVIEVNKQKYEQLKQSGGKFEVLEMKVPPSVKAQEA